MTWPSPCSRPGQEGWPGWCSIPSSCSTTKHVIGINPFGSAATGRRNFDLESGTRKSAWRWFSATATAAGDLRRRIRSRILQREAGLAADGAIRCGLPDGDQQERRRRRSPPC